MRKESKTKEAPASELELLRQRISQLETSEAKRRQGEEAANTLIHDLKERMKELSCLYGISDFADKENVSLERILEQTVNLIPTAWQYPQITCARIILDGREFRTENFRETTWKLLRDIIVHGYPAGTVEVCYLEEKPKSDEGPFLKEEGELISAIAKQLGEITRRKQMEEEIQESETRYRLLAENATDVIWTVDMNMRPTYISPSVTNLLGYSVEEAMGKTQEEVYTPGSHELAMKVLAEELAMGNMGDKDLFKSRTLQLDLNRKDGSVVTAEIKFTFLRDPEGHPVEILAMARDITERKRAEEVLQKSEEKYRDLVENVNAIIYTLDAEGRFTYVSPGVERISQYKVDELIGQPFSRILHPDDMADVLSSWERVIASGEETVGEYRWIDKDGSCHYAHVFSKMLFKDGQMVSLSGVIVDITERRQTEEALRQSEERYRTILESVEDGYFEVDLAGNFTFVSDAVCHISAYSREEMMGTGYRTYAPEKDVKAAYEAFNRVYRTGKPMQDFRGGIFRKDGAKRFLETSASAIRDAGGKITGFRGVMRDVTERMKTEQALRESEERYRLLAENVTDVIGAVDLNLNITYVSPSIERMLGYSIEEVNAQGIERILPPASLKVAMKALAEELAAEEMDEKDLTRSRVLEAQVNRRDGSTFWVEAKMTFLRDQDGHPVGILGVIRDVTERKKREEALRESEERYRLLAENVTDVIWTMDMNLRYTYISPSITRQRAYSVEEAMAQPAEETMTPASLEVAARALLDDLAPRNATERGPSRPHTLELEIYCKDRSTIWAEMTVSILRDSDGQPVGILGITRDITERKRSEEARVEQILALARAEELQQSRQRIVTAQESLRKEIAHQIHGTVQNRLIILLHRLAAVERTAPRGKLATELEEMHQTLENLLEQDMRLISQRLYPSILRQGLLPALQSLGDQFEAVMPVAIQLDEELMQQERTNREYIPEQVRLAVYRIAEEALTNVVKHAKASKVTMGLGLSSDGWLHLRVQDNGQGFDVESTYGERHLMMMQDYAEVAGGRCVIRSVLSEGTEVTATLPLAEPGAEHPETVSPLE